MDGFGQGFFTVQDESESLVSVLLAPHPGERALDLCAAPGGKTTHIYELMKGTGTVDEDGPSTKMMDVGIPVNSEEELYLVIEDSVGGSAIVPHPDGVQISQVQDWVAWTVDLSTLTDVDLSRIEKMTIGMGKKDAPVNNGVGTMFIDDIRLYRQATE